jgi:two-component system sensor histidine kinase/response regulator
MSKTKVLVVDDEVSLTKMIKLTLERGGDFEVRAENLGARALSAARAFRPDVVFLDVMMPDLSGPEVAEQLDADPELRATPYVFLTAMVTKAETASSDGEIGGRLFLAKPVKVQEMVAMIDRVLGRV